MIPDGWQSRAIGEVCDAVSVGIVVRPAQYYVSATEGVRAFRSANIGVGYVRDDDWIFISREGHERNPKSELKAGDVLIVRSGNAGISCVLPAKYAGVNCIDIVFARLKKNVVVPEYLCAFTNSELGRKQILRVQGGLALTHLNVGAYERINIPLPPFKEQQRIVSHLDESDRSTQRTAELIKGYRKLKSGLMQVLLSGKRRFPEFGRSCNAGCCPKGWEFPKTSKLFRSVSRKNHGHEVVLSVTQDQGVVPRDSLDRKINMTEGNTNTYKLVEPGDFIISLRSFQGGIEYSSHRGLVSPAYHVIRPIIEVVDGFYRHYFKSQEFIKRLAVAIIGIRDGKQVSYDDFSFMHIPLPPIEEQRKIAAALDSIDREIALLTKYADALTRQKTALMQKLLTGQIRVKV